MKTLYLVLISALIACSAFAQDGSKTLASEMSRLKAHTALIAQSQAIDEYPLWSPKGDFIACNIEGKWYKFRLTNIDLIKAKWHGQKIGMVAVDIATELTAAEQAEYEKVSHFNPREVTTADGTKVELKAYDMAVSMVVTKKDGKPKTLWTSGGENCHSLVLSPDGKFVAYLCELNGLLIMKLN